MGDALNGQRVNCRRCRYRFAVEVPPSEDWRIEAQCPCCDGWACFTVADTRDPPRPHPAELEAAAQRLGERLWQPINQNRGHPAVTCMDRVGNGVFEDDQSPLCWPVPCRVYRLIRGREAAYIWQEEGSWFVRRWHPLRSRRRAPEPSEVFSFEAGLDRLLE
jgi:hypothetical protein